MPPTESSSLPIAALREPLRIQLGQAPIVLSSPTGSGKSTQVPRYCKGRVLVVEPRRVACRALAARVAELEGCKLGTEVGYQVRDDTCRTAETRILFVTPGIALRMVDSFEQYSAIVLDEFHERGMDVDLLLALLRRDHASRLVVMSATLQAERIAESLNGVHLSAEGRVFPVEMRHLAGKALLPTVDGLEDRVLAAVETVGPDSGDMLVFLPGKGEISAVKMMIERRKPGLALLELHGGLALKEQSRVFSPGDRQRVILATNVAETSLTVPGIGVVIDAGLVRRTRYHHGRGYLSLQPIALDSAGQRAGRAGRLGPGLCIRLWSESAQLDAVTAPEIHRESLSPLLLAAAASGYRLSELNFLDPPKDYAVVDAEGEMRALGAIDDAGVITDAGRALFGLPLDPALGRLLVEARGTDAVEDVVDLCAALSVGRPLFLRSVQAEDPDSLRESGCDASAAILAVRIGDPQQHPLAPGPLREARENGKRLRKALGLGSASRSRAAIDRLRLARLAMVADPRSPHVARERKGRVAFSNGGTELELERGSCVGVTKGPEAVIVFGARGFVARGKTRIVITCASPVPIALLDEAGLGRDRVAGASAKGRRVVAVLERVYAKRVLSSREEAPVGEAARQTLAKLFFERRLGKDWSAGLTELKARLAHVHLARLLKNRRPRPEAAWDDLPADPGELETFLYNRLEELGVESGDDIWLLTPKDLLPEPLPYDVQQVLNERYPLEVSLGDAIYLVEYDLEKGRALLNLRRGNPTHAPKRQFLPAFTGLQVFAEAKGRLSRVQ